MRKNKDLGKRGDDRGESPGGHAMDRLRQLEQERGLPATEVEPGETEPEDDE